MAKQPRTSEQKRLDLDLWIIVLLTFGSFLFYIINKSTLESYITNHAISVVPRLLVNASMQFGIAGSGITAVCIFRKEPFQQFGLQHKHTVKSITGTCFCFFPYMSYIFVSDQFHGYQPFHMMITDAVAASPVPILIPGMALIVLVWGFFEGFNYVVICDKINQRYPSPNPWLDHGAITCAIVCLLFHPFTISLWGLIEILTIFIAIYGMLLVKKATCNAWGSIFAFCFIWNAL